MRLRLAVALAVCAVPAAPAQAEQTFPYTAHITTDDVYVRSGPGTGYYPTGKLKKGDQVEVYRHDPGGWFAVRPVEGSFSWVSGRYLEIGDDGLATVTGDRVAARVGTQFSDLRDVIQVFLHRGELVEVLGKKEFGADPGSGTWYRIAPPSGEFRWVFGRYVDPEYLHSGVRHAPTGQSPLVARGPSADQSRVRQAGGRMVREQDSRGTSTAGVRTAELWSSDTPSEGVFERSPAGSLAGTDERPDRVAAESVDPQEGLRAPVALRHLSPNQFQAEVDDIDLELSIMLAEEPTVWSFGELVPRAQALLAQAETAVQRGRARLLVNKIAQSEDLKRRYEAVGGTYAMTGRRNRQLAELSRTRERLVPRPTLADRFDGAGKLVRVPPSKVGAPRYALVDERGAVRCYVTPAPGVDIHRFLGGRIGVNGIRGYIAEQEAQHVTAQHVTRLDESWLR